MNPIELKLTKEQFKGLIRMLIEYNLYRETNSKFYDRKAKIAIENDVMKYIDKRRLSIGENQKNIKLKFKYQDGYGLWRILTSEELMCYFYQGFHYESNVAEIIKNQIHKQL
ncbi:MAG: hypothetical protein GX159_09710 [Flavobacteriaceae bacterium]|jgi:hypothetical protein|nr:hypothetical protein [Flavobacteriaceae bacterium]